VRETPLVGQISCASFARRQTRGGPDAAPKPLREKSKFANGFNAESAVQPFGQKYFCLRKSEFMHILALSRLDARGVTRRHEREAGCDGRKRARDERRGCGRRNRVVLAPLGWCQVLRDDPQGDGDSEVMDTGESAKISVNTIARGRPDDPVEPVVDLLVWLFSFHARLRVRPASGLPCALRLSRDDDFASPGRDHAAGRRMRVSQRHCEGKRSLPDEAREPSVDGSSLAILAMTAELATFVMPRPPGDWRRSLLPPDHRSVTPIAMMRP